MNHSYGYVAWGVGMNPDNPRPIFEAPAKSEYANVTVFVETPSVDPMSERLQAALTEAARIHNAALPDGMCEVHGA